MRITPPVLRKIARDTVQRRSRAERDVLAAYLQGSLLGDDPLLGGTTDIDLVFVHNRDGADGREIERLTDEVHLDIAHHSRRRYRAGRQLRLDPWMGPTLYACRILYDPHHFLDFTQAGVRGHFHRPDNVLARAQSLVASARDVWARLYQEEPDPGPAEMAIYLGAVADAANSVASLTGPPLPTRRLLQFFPGRADAVGRPGLRLGVLGLLGGTSLEADDLHALLPEWETAYAAAGAEQDFPPALHPHRWEYYQRALGELLAGDHPHAILWPLLNTWTRAVGALPADAPPTQAWQEALTGLDLLGDAFQDRVAALDAFLDTVEETLEEWGRQHGA